MAKKRSNQARLQQIACWLRATFPTPYPVVLRTPKRLAERDLLGETYRVGRKIYIRIAVRPGIPRYVLNTTLLHEWAHATSMRHDCLERKRPEHDDDWALHHGRIYRRFIDEGGAEVSANY